MVVVEVIFSGNNPIAAAKVIQLCWTLCDSIDGSPPGSSVHGIFPGKSTGVGCHCLLQTVPYDISKPQRVIIPLEERQGFKTWSTLLHSELKTCYIIFFTWLCFLASLIEVASSHHKILGIFIFSLIYNLNSQEDLTYSLSLTENQYVNDFQIKNSISVVSLGFRSPCAIQYFFCITGDST